VLFGTLGTIRERKEQHINALVENLHAKLDELEALNAQLRETDRLKDEFLGTISHELKTPLVTIRGYAEMLLHGRAGSISARQTHLAKQVLKNVDRQIQLIDDLLIYIRIRTRPDDRECVAFDLRETLQGVRETFAPSLERKGLHLGLVLPDEPLMVFATRSNVEIVLNNLVSNAIKFTETGGEIRIEARDERNGRIRTRCSDTGCGIPHEALEHVFERFRQADGSTRRKHGGTGLGLAIVRKILDNYDCSIEVESEPGQGTTFSFELPAASARQSLAAATAVGGSEGNGRGK
jgi:signal transduction histidine kinase